MSRLETVCDVLAGALVAFVLGTLVAFGFGCAAEVDSDETVDIDVTEQAVLANGCHGYVVAKTTLGAGLLHLPWYNGSLWEFTRKTGNVCYYNHPGFQFIYGPTSTSCARVDDRTWYCGGFGIVACPTTVQLQKPHEAGDAPFGPFTSFGRHNYTVHNPTLPFFGSSFVNNRVQCTYNAYDALYGYERRVF